MKTSKTAKKKMGGKTLEKIESLSPRRREVFDLVVMGNTSKQIASKMGITESTVKAHRRELMMVLDASSSVQLTRMAARAGVIK